MEAIAETTAAFTIADFQVSQILILISWRIFTFIFQQDDRANVLSSPTPASPRSASQKNNQQEDKGKNGEKKRGYNEKKPSRLHSVIK